MFNSAEIWKLNPCVLFLGTSLAEYTAYASQAGKMDFSLGYGLGSSNRYGAGQQELVVVHNILCQWDLVVV